MYRINRWNSNRRKLYISRGIVLHKHNTLLQRVFSQCLPFFLTKWCFLIFLWSQKRFYSQFETLSQLKKFMLRRHLEQTLLRNSVLQKKNATANGVKGEESLPPAIQPFIIIRRGKATGRQGKRVKGVKLFWENAIIFFYIKQPKRTSVKDLSHQQL